MVDDHGQVALAFAVGDLIDPDPLQIGEQVDLALRLGADPLADPPDRSPGEPQQLGDRGVRAVDRKPGDLVLELAGEAGAVAGPGDGADGDPVAAAAHSRAVGLDVGEGGAEIERPPTPSALAEVVAGRAPPADPAAIELGGLRSGGHHHLSLIADPDVLDHRSLQPEQAAP